MSLMDEFKKIIHPYDDEDDDYEEDVGRDSEPTYFEPREPREPRESSRRKEVPAEERRNKVMVLVSDGEDLEGDVDAAVRAATTGSDATGPVSGSASTNS